ncbi:M23 family metallopeptidase [Saccharothrix obliqua]|uniref:M23 family metallopeptidase n=1 Tax=Saccharothrix obliqua TaxID=2861747 RepID=UPI001C5F3D96|nr:M23 family metallopeptidase [Saccharothrix obliqua]MBW4722240.1 peptidoglycan DD-metalloendopeptidase family protein [Saccharothrix obliqua]
MRRVLVTLLVAPLVGLALTPGEAAAAPNFQLPFPCNQVWEGQTRTNHSPANSVDFNRANDDGDPVVASAAGTVTRVANEGATSYGRWVEIDHGGGWRTRYAHLSAQRVSVGQAVKLGQLIGNVGTTGGSTGPHLHYEQRLNGADQKAKFNGVQAYYWGTRGYTSKNSCGTGVTGTVGTDSGAPVTIRSGPSTSKSAVGSVASGASVTIRCQVKGETITGKYGTTDLWDNIGSGYVSDAYVYTGSDGQVAPAC